MKMKSQNACGVVIILLCLSAWLPNIAAAGDSINWLTYDEGLTLARIKKKKVFLHFYANWCIYCRKMAKEAFEDPSVVSYLNKNFIAIRINTDKDRKTASMYGVRGLPSTWFLTQNGEKIGNLPGYVQPDPLLSVLRTVSAGVSDDRQKKQR
jgi:thioredoxin-related protein